MSWILIVKVQKIWQLYHVLVWLSSLDWRRRAWNFLSLCWDGQQIAKSPQHNISTKYHVQCLYSNSQIKWSLRWFPKWSSNHKSPTSSTKLEQHKVYQHFPFTKSIFPVSKEVGKTFRPTILHASFPRFPFFFVEASLLQSRPQSFKNFEEVDTWAKSRRGVANPRGYTPLEIAMVMGRLVAMKVNKSHQEGLKYGLIYSQHCVTHMASKH